MTQPETMVAGMPLRHAVGAAMVVVLCLFAQRSLWRWLRASYPDWAQRHRAVIVGCLVFTCVLPFFRVIRAPAIASPLSAIVAVSILWQIVVALAMIVTRAATLVARPWIRREAFTAERHDPALPDTRANEPGAAESVELPRRVLLERIAGTAALGASAALFGWGMVRGRRDWTVCEVPIRLARLPKVLDGFTIVQISDVHVGPFMLDADLDEIVERVGRLAPDLVAITGDVIDHDPRYIPMAAQHLGKLRARAGVVCVPGNHDHYTGADLVVDGLQRANIDVLLNRGKILMPEDGGGIAVLGVDDLSGARRGSGRGPDFRRAAGLLPPDRATVLLAHQPQYIDKIDHRGIDLQLSGHMHGGQINPGMGLLSLFAPYIAGRYDVRGTVLYVNRGCGVAGPPVRLGSAPEITRIVLVS